MERLDFKGKIELLARTNLDRDKIKKIASRLEKILKNLEEERSERVWKILNIGGGIEQEDKNTPNFGNFELPLCNPNRSYLCVDKLAYANAEVIAQLDNNIIDTEESIVEDIIIREKKDFVELLVENLPKVSNRDKINERVRFMENPIVLFTCKESPAKQQYFNVKFVKDLNLVHEFESFTLYIDNLRASFIYLGDKRVEYASLYPSYAESSYDYIIIVDKFKLGERKFIINGFSNTDKEENDERIKIGDEIFFINFDSPSQNENLLKKELGEIREGDLIDRTSKELKLNKEVVLKSLVKLKFKSNLYYEPKEDVGFVIKIKKDRNN